MKLTILGAPRTKKNSGIITTHGAHPRILPSPQFSAWNRIAQMQIRQWQWDGKGPLIRPIEYPINVSAAFYRDKLTGDAVGYYQALADALEEGQIVENDRLIVSWDGSRLKKDSKNPRIEIEITEAES
jgi:Holliday junction resolvase RusA-like endonuclease